MISKLGSLIKFATFGETNATKYVRSLRYEILPVGIQPFLSHGIFKDKCYFPVSFDKQW